ncbi:preprotein translocase subunit YajC [Lachnospira multipara]|jgi:preprotein translocase subunit YajC|uniref:preprotein translocase subunit YajC n=1 Tax=Lachnospira multipara TaxID=28051 RepID=UPI0004E1ABC1|nr:preprotein translocase subunit YajC [Lachnospira multipara]
MNQAIIMIIYIVAIVVMMYFLAIRPQRKQQKEQEMLLESMAVGDAVLTTSGFYGTIVSIFEDDVIVEFGGNKNCRITVQKKAIAQVEKTDNSEN